jgi:hypothetical protein
MSLAAEPTAPIGAGSSGPTPGRTWRESNPRKIPADCRVVLAGDMTLAQGMPPSGELGDHPRDDC